MRLKDSLKDSGQHTVLIVDDLEDNVFILKSLLTSQNYKVLGAYTGRSALEICFEEKPDLVLLDLSLPDINGVEVLQEIRQEPSLIHTGIIILTATSSSDVLIKGFMLGADDFIKKPYHHLEMLARMQATLKLRDTYAQLRHVNAQLDSLNKGLEVTVKEQVNELEQSNRLKRFMAPQVIDSLMTESKDLLTISERRKISVLFLDLRGFTAYANSASPESLMTSLQHFHKTIGPVIFKHQATIERFTGDGLMCIIGAPNTILDHSTVALDMAREIRTVYEQEKIEHGELLPLDMSMGIATGEATTGTIGFEGRLDYAAIGPVTNMAARLCAKAGPNEILISHNVKLQITCDKEVSFVEEAEVKGFDYKVKYYRA
ncbi:response regulator [Lentisphaera profundi]|uniref:Response regulator n=1 Tax=Lentisphaera profundi TaxID=1658616 RepID=A0ABY7W2Y6_9BACT|nr:response regulator [Lentisphaera profundi]WDE98638.1 response regulator [Lentisphaera profundi]